MFTPDFQDILRAQEKKPTLDGVRVLIERAPQCKSIYVSGFPPCTSKDEAQMYFEERVGALDPARGVEFSPRWDEPDEKCRVKRAIVYFNDKESEYNYFTDNLMEELIKRTLYFSYLA